MWRWGVGMSRRRRLSMRFASSLMRRRGSSFGEASGTEGRMWAGAIHTIKSADQQTADFVSEKDVKARSKAEQKQSKSRAKAEQKQSKSRAKAEQKQDSRLGPICLIYGDQTVGGGLLPIAVGQSQLHQLTHPHREQAPSHIWTELELRTRSALRPPRPCF